MSFSKASLFIIVLIIIVTPLFSEGTGAQGFSFQLVPQVNLPMGTSADRFSPGPGVDLMGFYFLP